MLNTIYEEFDLQEKIKGLQNKKVKIKRLIKVRGDDSESVLQESCGMIDSAFLSDTKMSARQRVFNTSAPNYYNNNNNNNNSKESANPSAFSIDGSLFPLSTNTMVASPKTLYAFPEALRPERIFLREDSINSKQSFC